MVSVEKVDVVVDESLSGNVGRFAGYSPQFAWKKLNSNLQARNFTSESDSVEFPLKNLNLRFGESSALHNFVGPVRLRRESHLSPHFRVDQKFVHFTAGRVAAC